ncbi:MAG: GTP-binding protein, partial [Treponema bryantii]|nr:GTP-binding protein [Treponema bryantii]
MSKKIPITLLCGYLGAGKTTLLNRVLTNQKGYKVAVIVNDIGEVNVDEALISREAKITDTSSIVPLTNGCICCNLKSDMVTQIEELMKTGKFDYI